MKNNLKQLLQFKNQTENSADLYIYGDIVSDSWSKWQDEDKYPMEILSFLNSVQGKDLNIYINSGGGALFAGMAIYNMLKRHEGFKTAYIDGLAGSISSVIPLSCNKVVIPSNAYYMTHKPLLDRISGNAIKLREYADNLDDLEVGIVNAYMAHAKEGVTEKQIISIMHGKSGNGTWFTGESITEFFNFEVSEALNAVAFVGEAYKNFKEVPKLLQTKTNTSNEKIKCDTKLRLLSLRGATK